MAACPGASSLKHSGKHVHKHCTNHARMHCTIASRPESGSNALSPLAKYWMRLQYVLNSQSSCILNLFREHGALNQLSLVNKQHLCPLSNYSVEPGSDSWACSWFCRNSESLCHIFRFSQIWEIGKHKTTSPPHVIGSTKSRKLRKVWWGRVKKRKDLGWQLMRHEPPHSTKLYSVTSLSSVRHTGVRLSNAPTTHILASNCFNRRYGKSSSC